MTALDASRRAVLATAATLVAWPWPARAVEHERRHLFGSPVDLLLPARTPRAARDDVMAGLEAMNARWNAWKPGDLTALNEALRAGRTHRVAPMMATMIRDAAALETASLGCFSPAIGGLVGVWGFHADELRGDGLRPSASEIAHWTTARPRLAQLELRGLEARSSNPTLQLDFGAYAKGVAIDWALDRLRRRHGVQDALLNLGGNLAAMGRIEGRSWRVGIRDPEGAGIVAQLCTDGREAVVTSGTYERWRVLAGGQRATHIIDPASGLPASALTSVTVVHPSAALADAAATALLVAGPARWRAIAQRMGVDQVLVIRPDGGHEVTPRLATRLHANSRTFV
jgi:thiamine biosynthesis lipoprotein